MAKYMANCTKCGKYAKVVDGLCRVCRKKERDGEGTEEKPKDSIFKGVFG